MLTFAIGLMAAVGVAQTPDYLNPQKPIEERATHNRNKCATRSGMKCAGHNGFECATRNGMKCATRQDESG